MLPSNWLKWTASHSKQPAPQDPRSGKAHLGSRGRAVLERPRERREQRVGEERLALARRGVDEPERAVEGPQGAPPRAAAKESFHGEALVEEPARSDERGDEPRECREEERDVRGEEGRAGRHTAQKRTARSEAGSCIIVIV
jgi:hypothetical protein